MSDLTRDLLERAAVERATAADALEFAVHEARAAGWSWDSISAALGGSPNGETLRRRYGPGQPGHRSGNSPAQ